MPPNLQNIRTDTGFFSGDPSTLTSGNIYNAPITGGFYSGEASGYKDAFARSNAPAPSTSITSSSGTARADDTQLGKDITTASNPAYVSPASDKYLAGIDAQRAALEQRRVQEEANIQAEFESLKASQEGKQAGEVGSTSAALARAGGYLGVSGSGTGVLLNLAQSHRAEMQSLEGKRQQALSEARNAYTDKQFDLARLRATEAKAIEKETYARQQDYFDKITKATEANAVTEKKQKTQVDIYNAIAKGVTDPMAIFQELDGKTSIADINDFLTKSTPKDTNGEFAYTTQQTARLLGSGLSASDIKTAQEYINQKGYTEEFRSQLSPGQRVAFDSVYREKAVNAKAGKGLTADFIPSKISGIVGQYGLSKVFEDLLSPNIPDWFNPVIQEIAANHYQDIGMGAPSSLDPSSEIAKKIWKQFKSTNDIGIFLQQMTKEITGSTGSSSTGSTASFGALNSSLPAPVEG